MAVNIYLVFNGQTKEALALYKEAFNTGDAYVMTFGEAHKANPSDIPEGAKDLVMHAKVDIAGSTIMFSDTFPGQEHTVGNNVTLAVVTNNQDEIRKGFDVLAREGNIMMALQETFWSKCYGSLTDKFGVEWQFSLEQDAANE